MFPVVCGSKNSNRTQKSESSKFVPCNKRFAEFCRVYRVFLTDSIEICIFGILITNKPP